MYNFNKIILYHKYLKTNNRIPIKTLISSTVDDLFIEYLHYHVWVIFKGLQVYAVSP